MEHAEAITTKLLEAAREVGGATWPMLVANTRMRGIGDAAAIILFAGLLLFGWRLIERRIKGDEDSRGYPENGWEIARVVLLAVVAIFSLIVLTSFSPIVAAIFSPEGETLRNLLTPVVGK